MCICIVGASTVKMPFRQARIGSGGLGTYRSQKGTVLYSAYLERQCTGKALVWTVHRKDTAGTGPYAGHTGPGQNTVHMGIGRENITVLFAYLHTVHTAYTSAGQNRTVYLESTGQNSVHTYVSRTGEYGTVYFNK